MKKLTYLSSAIAAALGFSATANADIISVEIDGGKNW